MFILLLSVIYLAFISLGLPDSLLGSGWPVMHTFFHVSLSSVGIISMTISAGTIISSLLSDRLTRKLGTRFVTLISVCMTAAALFGFSISTQFWMLILWAIPYGLGAGAIDAALNNYVALHYTSRDMSWLHSFWGLGTIISPYIMSFALTRSNWQTGYRYVSYLQFAIAFIILISLPLWKIHKQNNDPTEVKKEPVKLKDAIRIPGVPQLLIGFLCYCGAESTYILWASSYMIDTCKITEERAAAFASFFCIGITAGRFIAGFISNKLGDRNMIRLGASILTLGIVMISLYRLAVPLTLAGFILIGLGCAPIYPSIIHSTPANFGADNSQAIIGIQMASAYVGSTFVPPLFGLLGSNLGMWILPIYGCLFLICMVVMLEWTYRITGRNQGK